MAVRSKMWLLTASWDTRVSGYTSRGQRLLVPSQDLRDSPGDRPGRDHSRSAPRRRTRPVAQRQPADAADASPGVA